MDKLQTLKEAGLYIEETLNKAGYNMNYSFYSIKPIDNIIDQQFENGKFKNPDSDFAKNGYYILLGFSSYLANVILKNSNSEIVIDENDEDWHINFKLVSKNGWEAFPGQKLHKRITNGREDELFTYAEVTCNYFNENHITDDKDSPKASIWKRLFKNGL